MSYDESNDIWRGTWHADPRGQTKSDDSVSHETYVRDVLGGGHGRGWYEQD